MTMNDLIERWKIILSYYHAGWKYIALVSIKEDIEKTIAALPQWISVEDRLPEEGEQVLLCHHAPPDHPFLWIVSGSWGEGKWWCDWSDDAFKAVYFHTVTHWANNLPQPPEE